MMRKLFGQSTRDEDSEWISVADLMAGLMVIFLFLAIVYIRPLAEERVRIKDIAVTWQESEVSIYEALEEEFRDDLPPDGRPDSEGSRTSIVDPDPTFGLAGLTPVDR